MSESVSFSCPLPPRALRTNHRTPHHGYRAALVREYQEQVWCAGRVAAVELSSPPNIHRSVLPPWAKACVELVWRHAGVAPDEDNALASCKYLIDVLKATGPRPLRIVRDDSPDCLSVAITTRKVAHRAQEGVEVTVVRIG